MSLPMKRVVNAGYSNQNNNTIAIGANAGYSNQNHNTIAIGARAGQSGQHPHTVIISALSTPLNSIRDSSFYAGPLRQITLGQSGFYGLAYNPTTYEFAYET